MKYKTIALIVLAVLTLWSVLSVLAQGGGGYDLTWSAIDGGGGTIGNGGYALEGTIGQPDASNAASNADYTLSGGFWFSAVALQQRIYLPLVLKSA